MPRGGALVSDYLGRLPTPGGAGVTSSSEGQVESNELWASDPLGKGATMQGELC